MHFSKEFAMRFISLALTFALCLTACATADARPWRIWVRSPIAVTPAVPAPATAAVAVQPMPVQPQPPMTFQAAPPATAVVTVAPAHRVATYASVRVKHRHHGRHIHHRSRSVSRSWAVVPAR
jgi:hypothetical protein